MSLLDRYERQAVLLARAPDMRTDPRLPAETRRWLAFSRELREAGMDQPVALHDISPGDGGAGSVELVYRYTVTGSDKASIDTGVDTPNAGSNDWTNGDLLEVFLVARTDEAVVRSPVLFRLNNDSGANYDLLDLLALNTTVSTDGPSLAQTAWSINLNGASCAANFFSSTRFSIPNYMGTTAYKRGDCANSLGDSTAANVVTIALSLGYRSTTAITRLSIAPSTAAKNFKVGTQLLIYKLRAS